MAKRNIFDELRAELESGGIVEASAILDEIEERHRRLMVACRAMLADVEEAERAGDPCCVGSPASRAARAALAEAGGE